MKPGYMLFFVAFMGSAFTAYPQDLPVESQYLLAEKLVNPALTGSDPCFETRLTHKQQWVDMDLAPRTQTLSLSGRVGKHTGLGVTFFNDRNGFTKMMGGRISYGFHISLSKDIKSPWRTQLSFGAMYSFQTIYIDDNSFNNQIPDPAIDQTSFKTSYSNAGVGIYFMHKGLFAGISAMNLLPVKIDFYQNEPEIPKNYFFQAGYVSGENSSWSLRPSVLFKTSTIDQKQIDLNLGIRYTPSHNNNPTLNPVLPKTKKNAASWSLWSVSSYQRNLNGSAAGSMGFIQAIGMDIKAFSFAYAYTIPLGDISTYYTGAHQIMLGIRLCTSEAKVKETEDNINQGKVDKQIENTASKSLGSKPGNKSKEVTAPAKNKGKAARQKKFKERPNKIKLKRIKNVPCHSYDRKK